jgi:hypothetical protein
MPDLSPSASFTFLAAIMSGLLAWDDSNTRHSTAQQHRANTILKHDSRLSDRVASLHNKSACGVWIESVLLLFECAKCG